MLPAEVTAFSALVVGKDLLKVEVETAAADHLRQCLPTIEWPNCFHCLAVLVVGATVGRMLSYLLAVEGFQVVWSMVGVYRCISLEMVLLNRHYYSMVVVGRDLLKVAVEGTAADHLRPCLPTIEWPIYFLCSSVLGGTTVRWLLSCLLAVERVQVVWQTSRVHKCISLEMVLLTRHYFSEVVHRL